LLVATFLRDARARDKRPPVSISSAALQTLARHDWPGNVRELRNVTEYVAAIAEGSVIDVDAVLQCLAHLPRSNESTRAPTTPPPAARSVVPARPVEPAASDGDAFKPIHDEIEDLERSRMAAALEASGGNQTRAASLIGMPIRTFATKSKKFGLGPKRES
jgi:DNA-binding NtrC family response regulator